MDRYIAAPPGTPASASAASQAETVPPSLWNVLWRQKTLVMIPVAVLLLLAVVYLVTEPKRYQTIARLEIKPAGSRLSGDSAESGQLSNFLYTQGEKMLSREILALALAQPIPADAELPGVNGKQVRDLRTFKESEDVPLKTIKNFAEVSVGKKDDALSVSYESPFQAETPIINNAIVYAFMKYQTQPKQSNVAVVLEAYHNEKAKVEQEVNQITGRMDGMENRYGVLSNNGDDNLAIRQLTAISQQLALAHADTIRAKSDADEAMLMSNRDSRLVKGGEPNYAVISADDEQVLRANLTQLQARLQEMQSHYLPEHPTVRALRQKVELAAASYAEAVHRRYLRAQTNEDDLRAQFEQQQKRAMEVSAQAAVYAHLKEDADRVRRVLEKLDTGIHGLELQQAAGAIDIDFFDKADVAGSKRSHPSKTRALGLALVLGLMLGCGIALLRDWADDRLHSSDEIKTSLGMPLLGAIPQMPPDTLGAVAAQKSVQEPAGEVAEAFRSVRTAIHFGAPKDRSKTILITSPNAGDGKSTAAANLAVVLAQSGKRVLLIDADLRNPSLNAIYNLKEGRPGLSSLLAGQGTWEQSIQRAPTEGLDLLAAGPRAKNPSDLLNSAMFSELLEMAAEKYDQIIVDAPPVLGLADARIIAATCDLTVLVLRADKSTRKVATLARDGLTGVGARVLGVIVNDVSRRSESQYDNGYRYPDAVRQAVAAAAAPEPVASAAVRSDVLARRPRKH